MNTLFTRDLEKLGNGRIAYGAILNDSGGIIGDSMVMVRGDDSLRVVGGPDAVVAHAEANGLTAAERREELAHLNIQGPRSRDLLAALTDTDVSNEAFPYYTFKENVTVAGIPGVSGV